MLKAEVLFAGERGCPVCGEKKTERARTCRACYNILGREIARRVDAVTRAAIAAQDGHLSSQSQSAGKPVARDIIWGPVLAQVEISKNAAYCIPSKGISSYWDCGERVNGGYVSLFVFIDGVDAKAGDTVTAWVELMTKDAKAGRVHYIRAQAVREEGINSNVKLVIGEFEDDHQVKSFPVSRIAKNGRRFSVGFVNI